MIACLILSSFSVIVRTNCGATIDNYTWDLTLLDQAVDLLKFTPPNSNYEFRMRLCTPLTNSDVRNIEWGSLAAKCIGTTCATFIYKTDLDYIPIFLHDPGKGIQFGGDGSIIQESTDPKVYGEHRLVYNVFCDSIDPPNVTVNFQTVSRLSIIEIKIYSKYGCPTPNPSPPSPTPSFSPDCSFVDRMDANPTFGIAVELSDFNNGPYGIRNTFFYNNVRYAWFYTPCGIGDCPIGTSCPDDEPRSSLWICTYGSDKIDNCVSYGFLENKVDVKLYNNNIYNGIVVNYTSTSNPAKTSQIYYRCDEEIPQGYIEPATGVLGKTDDNVQIIVYSSDVCIRPIPSPVPPGPDNCTYDFSQGNYHTKINLASYEQTGGIITNITIRPGDLNLTLIYQPCSSVPCPDRYDCEGDDDGNVWLCDTFRPMPGRQHSCIGFGLSKNPRFASMIYDYIFNGVEFLYTGDHSRKAIVHWRCDKSADNIYVHPVVAQFDDILFLNISTKDACPVGDGPTPTPEPRYVPILPTPNPTPNPIVSPFPKIFGHNDTHFLFIDLSSIDNSISFMEQIFGYRGSIGQIFSVFSPWIPSTCPFTYDCGEFENSNLWTCWVTNEGQRVCHSSGYKHYGLNMTLNGNDLESGVIISYGGGYNVDADIKISCDPYQQVNSLRDLSQEVGYHLGFNGYEFDYSVSTDLGCPARFRNLSFPNAGPTPLPDPYYTPSSPEVKYDYPDGSFLKFNINQLPILSDTIYMGTKKSFHIENIYYDPNQQTECPSGYRCVDEQNNKADAWKCFEVNGVKRCYPIGNQKYLLDITSIEYGLSVHYGGGYNDSSFSIHVLCAHHLNSGEPKIEETGTELDDGLHIVYVHSKDVCVQFQETSSIVEEIVTGGAIFLAILFSIAVYYVFIGTIRNYRKTGEIEFPSLSFWSDFTENVKVGAIYIFTCGKKSTSASNQYEDI